MAAEIGTAASIVGLITAAVTIVRKVQQTRETIRESSKTLEDVSLTLEAIAKTLDLVQCEPRLQTHEVGDQVKIIEAIASDLDSFLIKIHEEQQKSRVQRFSHAWKAGDANDKALARILRRLENARSELLGRIAVIHVGLSGNLQDGYRVGLKVLEDTNVKVRQVLGLNLAFAERLHNRELRRVDSDTILLDPADIAALQLSDQPAREQTSSEHGADQGQHERLRFHGNTTGDEPRIFVGSLGVEDASKTSNSKANISNNEFGKGASFMVADVGGEAALNISKSFF